MQGRSTEEFVVSLEQAIDDQLARSPGWLRRDAFARVTADYLIEDGTLEDLEICFYQAPAGRSKMEVSGYATSDDGQVLDLAITSYGRYGQPLPSDQVSKRFRW